MKCPVDMLSTQAHLDRQFGAVLAPSQDFSPGGHCPTCRNINCEETVIIFSMLILKTRQDEHFQGKPKHFSCCIAEIYFGGSIEQDNPAVFIGTDHCVANQSQYGLEIRTKRKA